MRTRLSLIILSVIGLGLLALEPPEVQAHRRRAFRMGVFHRPARVTFYCTPSPVTFYSITVTTLYCPPPRVVPTPRISPAPFPAPTRQPILATVGAYDNYFEPNTINVPPGTTVRWVNYGMHSHTVTSQDGRFDSGDLPAGATYSVTFNQPGNYPYYCRYHVQDRMQGMIIVGYGGAAPGPGGPPSSGY